MYNVMFVNGNSFTITSAIKLKFVTVDHTPSRTANQKSKSLNKFIKLYGRVGFIIHAILMDIEFERLDELLGKCLVNISSAIEHGREAYIMTRNVK